MLFDKSSTGIDELKELTGFLYSYNNFENIRTDLELAQEDMAALIGDELMEVAEAHYLSDYYENSDFEPEDPPAEPPLTSADYDILTELVKKIQLPVAYFAIHSFSQNADVSHEDSGRKVKIDSEREKLPWEWMLDKDEKAILKKAHKTTDRLISFLEKNIAEDALSAWVESDARAAIKGQFIDSAEVFNSIYPIDNSRRFFLVISPFIREAERKYIKPALTTTTFDEIKTALGSDEGYADDDGILDYIRTPLAYFAMSIAIDRLAVEVLPEGVFQNLIAENTNTKNPAMTDVKREVSKLLFNQGQAELRILTEYLRKLAAGTDFEESDLTSGLNEDNLFARV